METVWAILGGFALIGVFGFLVLVVADGWR